jgi:hypothetical protein
MFFSVPDNVKSPVQKLNIVFESAEMNSIVDYKKLPNGHLEFEGCLQTTDEINRNTKNYPDDVLQEALSSPRIIELVKDNKWVGEIAHPWDRQNFFRSVDIYPKEVSHRICTLPKIQNHKVMSTIHTIEPCGSIVDSWITDEGMLLGFSMRGVTPYTITKTTPVKHSVVKTPMSIITYDIVFYPSHPDALIQTSSGSVATQARENVVTVEEIAQYITTESSTFKMFEDELAIKINTAHPIEKGGKHSIQCTLVDGKVAKFTLESNIMNEIAKYI